MSRGPLYAGVLIGALLFASTASCVSDQHAPSPLPTQEEVTSGLCPSEAEAISSGRADEATLTADVDADGTADKIRMVKTDGPAECSAFVVVDTVDGTLSAPAPLDAGTLVEGLGLPVLSGVAEIDGRPGADIYATVTSGASTTFLTVFSAASGRLAPMTVIEGDLESPFFDAAGSVTHLAAVDCAEDGSLVDLEASLRGDRYVVTRSRYRIEGDSFVSDGPPQRRTVAVDAIDKVPGLSTAPFGSCPLPPT